MAHALDQIEALHLQAVVAATACSTPTALLDISRQPEVISVKNATVARTSTALELYGKMLALHPSRTNPGSLWATAKVVNGSETASA